MSTMVEEPGKANEPDSQSLIAHLNAPGKKVQLFRCLFLTAVPGAEPSLTQLLY